MLWIHFCLTLALAQESPGSIDTVLWSNEQVVQQLLPELQGNSQALKAQIQTKRALFDAEGTYEKAFWQWQSEDVLNMDVLNALRVSLLTNNQQRLQQRFERFPFAESDSKAAAEYQQAHEEYWQLQNERDALDIKALDALMESVTKYPSLHAELETLESNWLRTSTMLMQDSTQQDSVSKVVLERQKVLDLRRALINHFVGGPSDIDGLATNTLAKNQ